MNSLTAVTLATTAVLGLALGTLPGAANELTRPQGCIELWAELGGFDSMMPDPRLISSGLKEQLTGTVAHVMAYVERRDGHGTTSFDPNPRHMFIYPAASGQYVVRFLDLPPNHTWPAPF
jgi:hypothetical protein